MLIPIPHISHTVLHVTYTYTYLSGSESLTDTPTTVDDGSTPPDETQSSSPPAAKRPALSSTQDTVVMWQASLELRSLMQTKGTTCSRTISSQVLITVFQSMQMGVPFSFDGSNGILGLCIVGKRMVAFVFPVFFLL